LGDVLEGYVLATGVCFSYGDGSQAFVYFSDDEVYSNYYSDNACTSLEDSEVYFANPDCTDYGDSSELVIFTTSAPDVSTFGNGILYG
jgi:hypothetical protein